MKHLPQNQSVATKWKNENSHKTFFDRLRVELGYKYMDDWYNVVVEDIHKNGGVTLLNYYNGSPSSALQSVYPEHNWVMWRFNPTPNGFWQKTENQQEFLDRS